MVDPNSNTEPNKDERTELEGMSPEALYELQRGERLKTQFQNNWTELQREQLNADFARMRSEEEQSAKASEPQAETEEDEERPPTIIEMPNGLRVELSAPRPGETPKEFFTRLKEEHAMKARDPINQRKELVHSTARMYSHFYDTAAGVYIEKRLQAVFDGSVEFEPWLQIAQEAGEFAHMAALEIVKGKVENSSKAARDLAPIVTAEIFRRINEQDQTEQQGSGHGQDGDGICKPDCYL